MSVTKIGGIDQASMSIEEEEVCDSPNGVRQDSPGLSYPGPLGL